MGPEPGTGLPRSQDRPVFQIEWREDGSRLSRSLKHRDWARAKRQADKFAAGFVGPELHRKADAEPEPLTLERLLDIYGAEVTPTKGRHSRQHDRAAMRMFLGFLGRHRDPATLSQRDWDRFIRARREGSVGLSGRPVSDRTIEYDLRFLIAVFNWAVKSRDERGRPLLGSNPLRGLKTPTEKNLLRVVLSEEEYQALLKVSRQVNWRFQVALVLTHETGHRIGAVRKLRWSDIDLEGGVILWRAEHEKSGLRTPDAGDRRGNPCSGRSAKEEPRNRGRSGAAHSQGSLDMRGLPTGPFLVEARREACRSGAQARQGLALAEA